jgi:hypothetical protein
LQTIFRGLAYPHLVLDGNILRRSHRTPANKVSSIVSSPWLHVMLDLDFPPFYKGADAELTTASELSTPGQAKSLNGHEY